MLPLKNNTCVNLNKTLLTKHYTLLKDNVFKHLSHHKQNKLTNQPQPSILPIKTHYDKTMASIYAKL